MFYRLALVLALLAAALGAFPALPAHAQTSYTPRVEWAECPFAIPAGEVAGEAIQCGYLIVPQDRAEPQGKQVRLAFAILRSTSANPAPDPVIYLEGGPGGSALTGLEQWLYVGFRATRDFVLFDQRGMGYSSPRLYCWETDALSGENAAFMYPSALMEDDPDAYSQALRQCKARLEREEGVDLHDYTSAASAADIADLRVALGYEQVNLYGISYGTRLALTVMRDHPEGIRSVMLDSTYPPQVDAYELGGQAAYRAFHHLSEVCAADSACHAAYPDVEARLVQWVQRWNDSPAHLDALDMDVSGDDVLYALFDAMYGVDVIPYLPRLIYEASGGNYDLLIRLLDEDLGYEDLPDDTSNDAISFLDALLEQANSLDADAYQTFEDELLRWSAGDWEALRALIQDTFLPQNAATLLAQLDALSPQELALIASYWEGEGELPDDTQGAFDAIECNEELPFNSWDDATRENQQMPAAFRNIATTTFQAQRDACAVWLDAQPDPREDLPVVSYIPTLVLAGEFDPVTPPEWGRDTTRTLPNSTFLEFPGLTHGVIDGGDCPQSIMQAFLDAPGAPVDTSCIAQMPAMSFVLP